MIRAGAAHAAVLAAVHAASFPADEAWDAAFLTALLATLGCFALLTPAGDGMVVGRVAAGEAEVLTLAVLPARRRAGVGAALLAAAAGLAAGLGAGEMFLEVSEANAAARALYARGGFVEVGRRGRYYADGSDALVLRRVLNGDAATGG